MFYHYSQNNSGGSFDFDRKAGITHHVIIEAASAEHADERAEQIGLYFDGQGDCQCCGNRWSAMGSWGGEDGTPTPQVYGLEVSETIPWVDSIMWMEENSEVAIHYLDGRIVWPKCEKLSYEEVKKYRGR